MSSRWLWLHALLAVLLVAGCADDEEAAPSVAQAAPGSAGAPAEDGACERLPPSLSENGACQISWSCKNRELRTFACFNDETGTGCGCLSDEMFGDAFTEDVSACTDAEALAALARRTCGWDVP